MKTQSKTVELTNDETGSEGINVSAIFMILLFLSFLASIFYIMLDSFK